MIKEVHSGGYDRSVGLEIERLVNGSGHSKGLRNATNAAEFMHVFAENQISKDALDIIEAVAKDMGESKGVKKLKGDHVYDEMVKYSLESSTYFSGINRNLKGFELAQALGIRAAQIEKSGGEALDLKLIEANPIMAEAVRLFKNNHRQSLGKTFSPDDVKEIIENEFGLHFHETAKLTSRFIGKSDAPSKIDMAANTGETWTRMKINSHLRPD